MVKQLTPQKKLSDEEIQKYFRLSKIYDKNCTITSRHTGNIQFFGQWLIGFAFGVIALGFCMRFVGIDTFSYPLYHVAYWGLWGTVMLFEIICLIAVEKNLRKNTKRLNKWSKLLDKMMHGR